MALALQQPKAIPAYVWILRRVHDEAFFSQTRAPVAGPTVIRVGIGDGLRTPFQAVLAHNYGTAFAGLKVLGQQQNAVREYVWPDVQNHFVAAEFRMVIDEPCARIHWPTRSGQPSNDLVPDVIAIELGRFLPSLRRRGVEFCPELLAPLRGFPNEPLCVVYPGVKLPVHAVVPIRAGMGTLGGSARRTERPLCADRPKQSGQRRVGARLRFRAGFYQRHEIRTTS